MSLTHFNFVTFLVLILERMNRKIQVVYGREPNVRLTRGARENQRLRPIALRNSQFSRKTGHFKSYGTLF